MDKLSQMAVVDRFLNIRILGLVHWLAPAKKSEIMEWSSVREFDTSRVLLRIRRLEIGDLVKTTEHYCLPKNGAICEQAGRQMMPEILAALEN